MLLEQVPYSFVKDNSYSHCPLKKRPVHFLTYKEESTAIEEEMVEVVDDIPEPENLSTKPEDLSKTADRHYQHYHKPQQEAQQQQSPQEQQPLPPLPPPLTPPRQEPEQRASRTPFPIVVKPSSSPPPTTQPPSPINSICHVQHPPQSYHQGYHHPYPIKTVSPTPPPGIAPIHPKKGRIEVIQHNSSTTPTAGVTATSVPLHFIATKGPMEPLNLNTPVESLAHYPTVWVRGAPLYPPHYHLPYSPSTYRYHHPGTELYPSYSVPPYPHSPPESHPSVSPPPHSALTCSTIQRPIARSYPHWTSLDHCGLSPTSSVGSGSLRSPPPITPEDLSSPGSDSGRSSAGSTTAGSTIVNMKIVDMKIEKSESNDTANMSSNSTSPRYQCPDCGKSYSTFSGLTKHRQFHCAAAQGQPKKSFSCKSCNKVYVSLGALKMHIRTHTLPCKCTLCGKAFSRPWLLQGHIRTHTGEKPFSCQHCNRAFADRSNLRAHLQTHSDVKKYSCDSCSKTFSRMSLLTKHQEGGCPGVPVPIGYAC